MFIKDAQREMRMAYAGASVGQAVSGLVWLLSVLLGTFITAQAGLIALVLGGMFIFPLTTIVLKLAGQQIVVSKENALNQLAVQVAFIAPLSLPLVGVIASYNINYFYPAFMVAIGVHYLPFMFLYGIWQFGILGGLLIGGGTALMYLRHDLFTTGGWVTVIILLIFAVILWLLHRQETHPNGV